MQGQLLFKGDEGVMYTNEKLSEYISDSIVRVVPKRFSGIIRKYIKMQKLEEIRLRVNCPVELLFSDMDVLLSQYNAITHDETIEMLHAICMNSVYSVENELKLGFVTLPGGARVGISGKPVMDSGTVIGLTSIQSFNIRIPHVAKGCAEPFVHLFLRDGNPISAIIASPPGRGKTTFLRDVARCFSDGVGIGRAYKTALADERNELSGSVESVPMLDVGSRTDVMSLIPKSLAMPMLIRSMSPEIIITDELMNDEDFNAAASAIGHGIGVIASVHSSDLGALNRMEQIKNMIEKGMAISTFLLKRNGNKIELWDEEDNILCGT